MTGPVPAPQRRVEEAAPVHELPARPHGRHRSLAGDPGAAAAHDLLHLGAGRHRRVARRRHRQGPVRRAVLHRGLRTQALEEAEDEPRGERVPSPDAVQDLEVLAARGLVQRAVGPARPRPSRCASRSSRCAGSWRRRAGSGSRRPPGRSSARSWRGPAPDSPGSSPSTSNPSAAVKSSSLPRSTSTSPTRSRLTSRARAAPPIPAHSDGR